MEKGDRREETFPHLNRAVRRQDVQHVGREVEVVLVVLRWLILNRSVFRYRGDFEGRREKSDQNWRF